jgi:hypothetical protein
MQLVLHSSAISEAPLTFVKECMPVAMRIEEFQIFMLDIMLST